MAITAGSALAFERGSSNPVVDFIDRWIFVFMAAFLTLIILIGFVPDSLFKIQEVEAGVRPQFPLIMHLHAVLMGSWMLLLLTQTTLMATGRKVYHMQLGIAGMVLAPAMVLVGAIFVRVFFSSFAEFAHDASPELQAQVAIRLHRMNDIVALMIHETLGFVILTCLALRARLSDSELHKRLMLLATTAILPAAFNRIPIVPHWYPESPISADIWPALAVAPMFLWDLYRHRKIHRAYWIYAAVMIPAGIALNLVWHTPWWHAFVPLLTGHE